MKDPANTAPRRTPWRDNIEALAMAIVLALLLKAFIVEAYKIPTGSMQPTLMGDPQNQVFDRILVDKLAFRVRDPERFEVVVFRYPLDRAKNFVKRLVGMPGEQIRIWNGDLWTRPDDDAEWTVLRRPANVQREHWKALELREPESPRWTPMGAGSDAWDFGPRTIAAKGPGRARYGRDGAPVVDRYFDGYPDVLRPRGISSHPRSGHHQVGDLRVTASVEAAADTGWIVLEITEGPLSYRAYLPGPATAKDAVPYLDVGSTDRARAQPANYVRKDGESLRLAAGRAVDVDFENLDDRLTLRVDDKVVASLDVQPVTEPRSLVYLSLESGSATFDDVMVWRDIYYTPGREDVYRIPEGQYFMLGDNTQDSSDSREWNYARFRLNDGSSLRGNNRRNENPLVNPGDPNGPVTWLVDEWGETHHFPSQQAVALAPEDAPFVDRSLVLGRALAVFWPIQPTKGIYRFQWVR